MALFRNSFFKSENNKIEQIYERGVYHISNKEYKLADEDFRVAAKDGHISAFYNLFLLNGAGLISPYDLDFSAECFFKAVNAGHPEAQKLLPFIQAADRGGMGTQNLAQWVAATSIPHEGLMAIIMVCAVRFFDTLCKKYGATNDVIAYEMDAASSSQRLSVQRFLERTRINASFYGGGMQRIKRDSPADQITDGLNEFYVGMKQAGYSEDYCLFARCTISGYIVLKSIYSCDSCQLLCFEDFFKDDKEF